MFCICDGDIDNINFQGQGCFVPFCPSGMGQTDRWTDRQRDGLQVTRGAKISEQI